MVLVPKSIRAPVLCKKALPTNAATGSSGQIQKVSCSRRPATCTSNMQKPIMVSADPLAPTSVAGGVPLIVLENSGQVRIRLIMEPESATGLMSSFDEVRIRKFAKIC